MTKIDSNENFLIKNAIAAYKRHLFLFAHSLNCVCDLIRFSTVIQTNYLCIAITICVHAMLFLLQARMPPTKSISEAETELKQPKQAPPADTAAFNKRRLRLCSPWPECHGDGDERWYKNGCPSHTSSARQPYSLCVSVVNLLLTLTSSAAQAQRCYGGHMWRVGCGSVVTGRALWVLSTRNYVLVAYERIISELCVALAREVQLVCLSVCICYLVLFWLWYFGRWRFTFSSCFSVGHSLEVTFLQGSLPGSVWCEQHPGSHSVLCVPPWHGSGPQVAV